MFVASWMVRLAAPVQSANLDPYLEARIESQSSDEDLGVFVHGKSVRDALAAVRTSDLHLVDVFQRVGVAFAVGSPSAILEALGKPGVTYLEGDRPIELHLDTAHKATRGDAAMSGFDVDGVMVPGADGSGISIAVVDSGIDGTHPMFLQSGESKVVRNVKLTCFSDQVDLEIPCAGGPGNARDRYFIDSPTNDTDTVSLGGHGTHVAGIAAGAEVTSGDRSLKGAAPGSKLVGISVAHTISVYGGAAGLNWVLEHHAAPCGAPSSDCPPIRVVNNSWGAGGEFDPQSTITKLQDLLVADGVVVVFANGNSGGDGSDNSSNPYGLNPTPGVISVANYNDDESGSRDHQLASSSSRGMKGAPATYPDLSAPGTDITSACRPQLAICGSPEGLDPNYGTISGTSMAAPMVAGIVAQLLQANPSLTPAQVEDILEDTAYEFAGGAAYEPDPFNPDGNTSFDKGHGLVDAMAASARVRGIRIEQATPPRLECAGGELIAADGRGDVSQAMLDLTAGWINWDGERLAFRIAVADLTEGYPPGRTGLFYAASFRYGAGRYFVSASRQLTQFNGVPPLPNGQTFTLGFVEEGVSTTYRTAAGGLSGSFDFNADLITIHLSDADIERANQVLGSEGTPPDMPLLDEGLVLRDLLIESRSSAGAGVSSAGITSGGSLLFVGDTADGACAYVIGGGAENEPPPPPALLDAKLSSGNPTFEWTSGPFTRTPPLTSIFFGDSCTSRDDAKCDRKRIEIAVPPHGATLTITTTSGDESADFDLYVFGPDGEEIGSSASEGSDEEVVVRLTKSGIYTVAVNPFFADNSSYSGKAAIAGPSETVEDPPEGTYDGTLSPGGTYSWTGGGIHANIVFRCSGLVTLICDTERIWVKVPPSGSVLTVNLSHSGNPDFTDLMVYLLDPAGRMIARSEVGGTNHDLAAFVTDPGVYRVAVTGLSAGNTYSASSQLDCPETICPAAEIEDEPEDPAKKAGPVARTRKKSSPVIAAAASTAPPLAEPEPKVEVGTAKPEGLDTEVRVEGRQQSRALPNAALVVVLLTGSAIGAELFRRRMSSRA